MLHLSRPNEPEPDGSWWRVLLCLVIALGLLAVAYWLASHPPPN